MRRRLHLLALPGRDSAPRSSTVCGLNDRLTTSGLTPVWPPYLKTPSASCSCTLPILRVAFVTSLSASSSPEPTVSCPSALHCAFVPVPTSYRTFKTRLPFAPTRDRQVLHSASHTALHTHSVHDCLSGYPLCGPSRSRNISLYALYLT